MSSRQWEEVGSPQLEEASITLTNFDGSTLNVLGQLTIKVQTDAGKETLMKFFGSTIHKVSWIIRQKCY